MLAIIFFYFAVSLISACILAYFIKSAPSGWENEYGFHTGNKKIAEIEPRKFKNVI